MKEKIMDALKQQSISESQFCWSQLEYKEAFKTDYNRWIELGNEISNSFNELLVENLISVKTEIFDCGVGNGLAVEKIYSLKI